MESRHVKRIVKSEVTTYSKAWRMRQCCKGSLKAVGKSIVTIHHRWAE